MECINYILKLGKLLKEKLTPIRFQEQKVYFIEPTPLKLENYALISLSVSTIFGVCYLNRQNFISYKGNYINIPQNSIEEVIARAEILSSEMLGADLFNFDYENKVITFSKAGF